MSEGFTEGGDRIPKYVLKCTCGANENYPNWPQSAGAKFFHRLMGHSPKTVFVATGENEFMEGTDE